MKCLKYFLGVCLSGILLLEVHGQTGFQKGNQIKINLSDDGKEYLRFTFLNQTWLRYTDANPGTTVNGTAQRQIFDIGLRRTRIQFFGQISDFERSNDYMLMYELGFNWLPYGTHTSKVSLNYQDRPVFNSDPLGNISHLTRKGMIVIQYQVMI